jgi:hypothetical protein
MSIRTGAVMCWYRFAIDDEDQPIASITARSGTPSRRTVAAVCLASRSRPFRMPSTEEAQRLMMAPGTPLLVHTRVGYDSEGRPVRYMVTGMAADRVEVSYDVDA